MAVAVLDDTLARIQESLQASGVQARLAVSGFGDWRFLDIVSIRAGKLEVLLSATGDTRLALTSWAASVL